MHFITGDTGCLELIDLLKKHGWGRMLVNRSFGLYVGEKWGFDNGQYRNFLKGIEFNPVVYLRRIKTAERMRAKGNNSLIMAVVPDIVKGGERSLDFSNGWIQQPEFDNGMPWHLAIQDGMQLQDVEEAITQFDYSGIFLGGSNQFKHTAEIWADLAHDHGLTFHYGRCGTQKKIRHAKYVKADSADSNFPLFYYERYWQVVGYLQDVTQCSLH